jgi:uncharacterized membrane protein YfcA
MTVTLALVSFVAGLLIGAVGIGGILLIPCLVILGVMPVHVASATALFTFIFTGALSAWLFARRGSLDWRASIPVCVGALAFSYAGAYVNSITDSTVLDRIIGFAILLGGLNVLFPVAKTRAREGGSQHALLLLGVGAVSGFGSGLTGAGGPLFSVPIMLSLGFQPLLAIGVSQILQIVSAASGTAANLAYGVIDFQRALLIIPFELLGVICGVVIAHRANVSQLRHIAGWLCTVAGVLVLVRGM